LKQIDEKPNSTKSFNRKESKILNIPRAKPKTAIKIKRAQFDETVNKQQES
jgi:hypothetical protein